MTTPREPDDRDPLARYADGDPDMVRDAAPPEPSEAAWEAARRKVQQRLARPQSYGAGRARIAILAGAAALVAASVAVAWFALNPTPKPKAIAPNLVEQRPVPPVQVGPHDPLADIAVLPMASSDDVVLHRVPGDGWLPVGRHPLPGLLSLATSADVELDDPDATWTDVTPAPGFAPMIFATKPR